MSQVTGALVSVLKLSGAGLRGGPRGLEAVTSLIVAGHRAIQERNEHQHHALRLARELEAARRALGEKTSELAALQYGRDKRAADAARSAVIPDPPTGHRWATTIPGGISGQPPGRLLCVVCTGRERGGEAPGDAIVPAVLCWAMNGIGVHG